MWWRPPARRRIGVLVVGSRAARPDCTREGADARRPPVFSGLSRARIRFSVSMSKCESGYLLGRAQCVSQVSPVCILCMHTVHIMHVGNAYYARGKAPKVHIMHAGYAYYARGKCPVGRARAYYAFSACYACGSSRHIKLEDVQRRNQFGRAPILSPYRSR